MSDQPKISKVLKTKGSVSLVVLETPVCGGSYVIVNGNKMKTGLCLDAANEFYSLL